MKTFDSLKTSLFYIAVIACLSACQSGNNPPIKILSPVNSFSIIKEALVKDQHGVQRKLSDVLVSDSTFVIRVTNNHPDESKNIALNRITWFTEDYPPTDSIIVLADQLPADTGWGQLLKPLSFKMRIFQIEDSLLPPVLESQQRAYLFCLNKQLQAGSIYITDSIHGETTNAYYASIAAFMGREQKNPLLKHTKGINRYSGTTGSNTSLYLSDRRASVGYRTVNTTYTEDFYFRNSGREPLVIYKVRNNWSGSANRVYVPEHPLNAGERDRIRVEYRPRQTGSFRNAITVYSNTTGSPHTLIISGTAVSATKSSKIIGVSRYKRF
jgi:hypothetical protein